MASKKKATAPVEEQTKIAEAAEQPQAVEAAQETTQTPQEAPEEVKEGVDLEDTALAGISGELAAVRADGGLNLRTGPGLGYPVEEVLEDGTLLAVLELPHGAAVPGWTLVHTGQRTGWVDVSFLQALETGKE